MSKEVNNSSLADFQWEDPTESFFGIGTEEPVTKVEEIEDKTPEDTNPETETQKKPKKVEDAFKEDEEEDDFFGSSFEEEQEEEGEEQDTDKPKTKAKPKGDGSVYSDLYLDFKDKQLFKHVELEEGEDLDHERFSEIMEEEYETEVTARLQHWAQQELDEDAQAFIKFKKEGGTTAEFFRLYQDSSSDLPKGDINDSKYQNKIIRMQLESEGWDEEEIEDRLEYLDTNGRKAKVAEKALAKMEEESAAEREELVRMQEQQNRAQIESQKKFVDTLQKTVSASSEIGGFKITAKDKKELVSFLTKPTHELNGRKLTGVQHKLGEVFKDPEKTLLLAKLLSSDFDMKDIVNKASSEKTKEIKSRMEQRSTKSRGGGSSHGKSVADFF